MLEAPIRKTRPPNLVILNIHPNMYMYPARCSRIVAFLPRTASSALAPLKPRAAFHASARANVKVGDSLPNLEVLHEYSPATKVNLARELTGKGLIIGVPAAFSTWILLYSFQCTRPFNQFHWSPPFCVEHPSLRIEFMLSADSKPFFTLPDLV